MLHRNNSRTGFSSFFFMIFLLMCSLSLAAPALAEEVAGCPGGMSSYWNLNETAGDSFADLVGGNAATCTACPSPENGKISGGQQFRRSAGTTVNAPGKAYNWTLTNSFSIEVWMKKSGACVNNTVAGNEVLVGRNLATSDTKLHWWLGIDCSSQAPSGVAAFKLRDNNNKFFSVLGTSDLTDGNWHHLAAVRDAVSHKILLYVDGKLEASKGAVYTGGFSASGVNLNIGWLNADGPQYRFSGVLDEIAIHKRVLAPETIRAHYYLTRGYCAQCGDTVKILPLGDSITEGRNSGRDNPLDPADPSNWISYRRDLWRGLVEDGFNVDFVGSAASGSGVTPPFDGDHEGHGGYTTGEILNGRNGGQGLADWLANLDSAGAVPDVVLLHIGTNDVAKMAGEQDIPASMDNLGDILDVIRSANEDATVVLAKILRRSCVASAVDYEACQKRNTLTGKFNSAIGALLSDRKDQGKDDKVLVVDMGNGAGIDYKRQSTGGDMWDEQHPSDSGFAKMAALWRNRLAAFLPVCLKSAPTITSADSVQVAVNQELNYTAMAAGKPAPRFRLNTDIEGMTIDAVSGKIAWTPKATGHYTATVIASNTEGRDRKTIDIYVTEAPVCPADITSRWKLDEAQGPTYEDSVGVLDGSCAGNCPKAGKGKAGGAQVFDGSYTGISVPADSSLNWASDGSFTVEYWIFKAAGSSCSGNEVAVGRDDAAKASNAGLHWWTGCYDDGRAAFRLHNKLGNGRLVLGTSSLLDGKWHHVAAVRDGASKNNLIYVDGVLENSASFTYDEGFDHARAALNFGHLNSLFRLKGRLDEVALYGRALDAGEIQEHFQRGALSYCDLAPAIYQQPESQLVLKGQTATFTVVAGGGAKLGYQWQFKAAGTTKWVNIKGARSATYTTPPTTKALHKSAYRCRVTNEYGIHKLSRGAVLKVNVPPVITTQPVNRTVAVGQTAKFTVKATGSGPLKYQWRKNGQDIAGANEASYTTPPATLADNGAKFKCLVTNAFETKVLSEAAVLTVQ